MKKTALLPAMFLFFIFFVSVVAAEIIISEAPKSIYNLGDSISLPVKITSGTDASNVFLITLDCEDYETEIYKEYLFISAGEEISRKPSIPLIKSFIGSSLGKCNLRYSFGSETKTTSEFTISNLILLNISSDKRKFTPNEQSLITGYAKKENGQPVNGFAEAELFQGSVSKKILSSETVKNGILELKFSIPEDTASGDYIFRIKTYEKDSKGEITNEGFSDYSVFVEQVPTSLEIFFEKRDFGPGENLKVKTILHDQTGNPIDSYSNILVKNEKGKTVFQGDVATEQFLNFKIPENATPATWTIKASSNNLETEMFFMIKEVEKISTEIVDKTLVVKNIGNVPYNKTIQVKIGERTLNLYTVLDVGETKKYTLTAPDGEYLVEITADENKVNKNVILTGKTVEIRENNFLLENITKPGVWIFVILVLGFVGLVLFRRWHINKKSFFGYPAPINSIKSKKQKPREMAQAMQIDFPVIKKEKKGSLPMGSRAELSLSVKGEQQTATAICLKIKNMDRLKQAKTNYDEVLKNAVNVAEEKKASVYRNEENIFFIFAPIKTKTFKNEATAIKTAQTIGNLIRVYNKMAREKIEFGISVNNGTIIANVESGILKFMALGNLLSASKKIASMSDQDVLVSEEVRSKMGAEIRTQRKEFSGTVAYAVTEVRDDEKSKEFIRRFMQRMEK